MTEKHFDRIMSAPTETKRETARQFLEDMKKESATSDSNTSGGLCESGISKADHKTSIAQLSEYDKLSYIKYLERCLWGLADGEVERALDDMYWMLSTMEAIADHAADTQIEDGATLMQLLCLIRKASYTVETLLNKLESGINK